MPFKLGTLIEGASCTIAIDRVGDGVILVRIEGHDVGEFGDTPLRCIAALVPDGRGATLFIDARRAQGATVDVSGAWARWLGANRDLLGEVHMLTSSRLVAVSAEFVRRFAGLDGRMRLYTDAAEFEQRLVRASV